jgi:hypothetical protein
MLTVSLSSVAQDAVPAAAAEAPAVSSSYFRWPGKGKEL